MKTLYRTFAILAAALVIVGALIAFSSTSSGTSPSGMPQRNPIVQSQVNSSGASSSSATSGAAEPFEHDSASGPSLAGLAEVLKNLGLVAVIIAIVSQSKRLLSRKRPPDKPVRRQSAPPTPAAQL
jgi:hypothetical protein